MRTAFVRCLHVVERKYCDHYQQSPVYGQSRELYIMIGYCSQLTVNQCYHTITHAAFKSHLIDFNMKFLHCAFNEQVLSEKDLA